MALCVGDEEVGGGASSALCALLRGRHASPLEQSVGPAKQCYAGDTLAVANISLAPMFLPSIVASPRKMSVFFSLFQLLQPFHAAGRERPAR